MRKKAIVTGGSRGIGKAIVLSLVENEYEVWYLSRTEAKYDNPHIHWVECDMSQPKEIEGALKTILEQTKEIDLLVNNAGITRDGLLMRMKEEMWNEVVQLNLNSLFYTCRSVCRVMASQRRGAIINISSVVGLRGNGGQTNYSATKAGVIGFSKSLAKELSSRNVRVNVVAPGFIATEMTDVLSEEIKEGLKKEIPLGRIGEAQEVASVVLFLASEAASYITGEVITVDGGMSM